MQVQSKVGPQAPRPSTLHPRDRPYPEAGPLGDLEQNPLNKSRRKVNAWAKVNCNLINGKDRRT